MGKMGSITVLGVLGLALLLVLGGQILFVVAAFRQSIGWGIAVLLIPFASLVYLFKHWSEARAGFLTTIAGFMIFGGFIGANPEARATFLEKAQAQAHLPDTQAKTKTEDAATQIAELRLRLETLEAAFAQDGVALMAQYQELDRQRKALAPNDTAAIEKFNVTAAAYQASNTRRKQMQQDIATTRAKLDQLLEARSRNHAANRPAGGKSVVVYSTSTCPACRVAKQYMAQKGVAYQEIDIERSPTGREAFQRLGGRGVPLIIVGEKRMEGFNSQEFDRML